MATYVRTEVSRYQHFQMLFGVVRKFPDLVRDLTEGVRQVSGPVGKFLAGLSHVAP